MNDMDRAAESAREELPESLSDWSAEELLRWVKANYRTAGYKRLIRPLLKKVA